MLQGVLIDKAVKVVFKCAGHFRWTTGARTVCQPGDALLVKPMHPLAQRRIGKVEGLRDALDALAFDNFAHGLRTTKAAHLLGLLEEGL